MPGKAELLERERRWSRPVAIATIVGAVFVFAALILVQSAIGGGANYEGLEAVHEKTFSVTVAGALNAVGFSLLLAPLLYLFRAVEGRSQRVKSGLVGLVIIAPLCLGVSGALLTIGTNQAATHFVDGNAKPKLTSGEARKECASELKEQGAKEFGEEFEASKGTTSLQACQSQKLQEDRASQAINDTSMVQVAQEVGLVGGLALVVALFYTCLWAMRTGLLSRFWGSLGMALGIATLIGLTPFTLIWFFYFGLLAGGWLPGGRPPAWEAGESVPWPSPGERAAADLSGPAPPEQGSEDIEIEGEGGSDEGEPPKRKRKQRT
jgi:hypothetical protein